MLFIEDSVDKRSKIYKFLSKEGHAVCFESAGDKELSRWLASLLKKEGKQMSSATMRKINFSVLKVKKQTNSSNYKEKRK